MQLVWDNLNLSLKHRFERKGDNYEQTNKDWMASLWIQDRIDVSHMEHKEGCSVLEVDDLQIYDMIPTESEKSYVFNSLISYFSSRLIYRHPNVFKCINSCIKQNNPHQFQKEMDGKSSEFTGELFTKSESRTEDLLSMMSKVQEKVHTFLDDDGIEHCHERKIVSGDNKTEKNMYHGILRSVKFTFSQPSFNPNPHLNHTHTHTHTHTHGFECIDYVLGLVFTDLGSSIGLGIVTAQQQNNQNHSSVDTKQSLGTTTTHTNHRTNSKLHDGAEKE